MLEPILIGIILALAISLGVRSLYRTFTGKNEGCPGCNSRCELRNLGEKREGEKTEDQEAHPSDPY